MNVIDLPEDYNHSRDCFLQAAEAAGVRCFRLRVPAENVADLFIDFALIMRNPEVALLHFSGVHGIEGFVGSAIQTHILSNLGQLAETGPSLLFIHGMNPYGMAFFRRANGENVDLNRNFISGKTHNPNYARFDSYLNPKHKFEFFSGLASGLFEWAKLGSAATAEAIASGQSAYPKGLFFSGTRKARELHLLQEVLRSHLSEAKQVAAIDVHSGLGKFGQELLFGDTDRDPSSEEFFHRHLKRPIETPNATAGTYESSGRFSDALRAALPQAKLRYLLQEFGSEKPIKVLAALRAENFEWHARPAGELPSEKIANLMLNAFFPRNEKWRRNALALGLLRWQQLHDALVYTARS